ncbi:MAG TPA: alpha/beta hydrolase fold domain-containing protein [Burkholderiaceae bacterium]|nr:alpha/beta hydrolase fold domain-containing protein [Burkholderiaceae bacterium]
MLMALFGSGCATGPTYRIDDDGTVHLPARSVKLAPELSEASRRLYVDTMRSAIARQGQPSPASLAELHRVALPYSAEVVRQANERVLRDHPVTVNRRSIAGVPVLEVVPANIAPANKDRVLVNLHGGAFIFNAGSLAEAVPVAEAGRIRVLVVDYRMPPEHPFPAALEDFLSVYRELLRSHASEAIGVYGSSAGAALTASAALYAQQKGLPMPGALGLMSFGSGDSEQTLDGLDPYLSSWGKPSLMAVPTMLKFYAPNDAIDNPLVNPIHADFTRGFPPSLLISGTRDLFLSGTVRLHRKMRDAGVQAELELWDGMWHGFNADSNAPLETPEAAQASRVIADFFRRRLR